jgi:tricorn protease
MFEENGRLMKLHYWRADMDGTDWDGVLERYRPLIEQLSTHDDLVDVLWETVAELNTSHAYVKAAPMGDPCQRAGFLGADLGITDDGLPVLLRIIPGESSDPNAWSPLRAAGVGAHDGDVVVAIDGKSSAGVAVGALLEGAVGKPVELTLRVPNQDAKGSGDSHYQTRRVAVVPLPDEAALRYHDWVASRVRYVDGHSNGKLGYLHVPDMMGVGWAQLHRMIDEATLHQGVIVDLRRNRGGHTSELVLERLLRRVQGWDVGRYSGAYSYPSQAVRGPIVLLADQWAGSDGDIVNAIAQQLGLTVVGDRTWGGVIGIDGRFDLVDGTEVTQPRYAMWTTAHGWGLENHGVDPDVLVVLSPDEWNTDTDPQLDTAIQIALTQLAATPAAIPPQLPEPRF